MAGPSAVELAFLLVGAGAALIGALQLVHAARWSGAAVTPAGPGRPRATVVVPARGEHHGFDANVRALAGQEYPRHEVLFVVDGEDDPAAQALRRLQRQMPRLRVELTDAAERAQGYRTGKMAAMMTGALRADPASEVLVFADADARPSPRWLASMVAPLEDPAVGAVTGYQAFWAASRATVWTTLRDALVNGVQMAMTLERARYLWGGSMAVRRADFERCDVARNWRRYVADDTGLNMAIKALGLRLAFAPGAIVASPEDWTRGEVLEWMARQYALIRDIDPKLYRQSAVMGSLSMAGTLLGLGLVATWPSPLLGLAGLLLLGPTLLAPVAAWFRWRLVARAQPAARERPMRERLMVLLWAPLLPFAKPYGVWKSARMASISWRGREYAVAGEARAK